MEGEDYRFSLNRYLNRKELSKTEAEREAETLRAKIRDGALAQAADAVTSEVPAADELTFEKFAEIWKERRGYHLVGSKENTYRLGTICDLDIHGSLSAASWRTPSPLPTLKP